MTLSLESVHAFATLYLTGLIWFVQVVHYPLFAKVGEAGYTDYQAGHVSRTGLVVAPAMLIEAATAGWLLVRTPTDPLTITGAVLLALIWISTFGIQVPCHARLEHQFDAAAIRKLVSTNWIRTVAWTARGLVALAMV